MTKQDVVDAVAQKTGQTKKDAGDAVEAVLDVITGALMSGDATSYGGDKSRADHALVTMLFRTFGDDVEKVKAEWFASGINPTKYARADYVKRTLRGRMCGRRRSGPTRRRP